ncbi:serine hydrolase domain-containing protein [Streptomyces rubellomurinus]|uniref:serine hydrolase domain-containing protein n=1 Tax=Streptomyces rubellomurinus (strain ATCC 31215) TaxID=359131 RepID=UPI0005F11EAD|nr:serine hydrolase domain-containing protein [Streptomyces rubellomurinus]
MTKTRRPRPAAPRSVRAAAAALAVTGLLTTAACSGSPKTAEPAGGAAVTAEPAALSPSASPSASPSGGVVALTPDVMGKLDAAIQQVMSQASVPGVIVGYTTPDGSYQKAFGLADPGRKVPMSTDLYTRIGSVTKTLTATAVLRLVDQGKVGLDDPISKYVPNVPNGDKITVRELGDMRSGLYNYSLDPDFDHALLSDPTRPFTPDQLLAYSYKHPADFAPDAKFEYSNTNAILLGLLVEKVSGQPLQDFLKAQVFDPAGMKNSVFPTDATFPDPHAHGTTNQTLDGAVADSTDWNPSWGWAAGAAISTLADLQTWSKVLATGTPLIKPDTQAERLKTREAGLPALGYGFGVFNTHGWIGHNGSLPGYQTVVIYLPAAQASLVIMTNTDVSYQGTEPSTLLARAITQIVSPNNVYTLPTPAETGSPTAPGSPSGSPSPSPSAGASRTPLGTTTPAPSGSATLHISEETDS